MTAKHNVKVMPAEASPKGWWEVWWGQSVILILTGVIAGLIIWAITRHYDKAMASTPAEQIRVPETLLAQPEAQAKESPQPQRDRKSIVPRVRGTPSPTIEINAPNGIAVGGGIVNNPVVNNFGEHLGAQPCLPPQLRFGNRDTTQPSVAILSPTPNATVSGTISLTAAASDNIGVSCVLFQVDDVSVGSLDRPPYSRDLDTTKFANGTHKFIAHAWDHAGNEGKSASVNVTFDNK